MNLDSESALSAADAGWANVEQLQARLVDKPAHNAQSGLHLIDPTSLQDKPIPERQWVIQDWIQIGVVTGLYADGGVGKSLLMQQLMTCAATGKAFLGNEPVQVNTLGFFCEDTEDELHRRQNDINVALGVSFKDLGKMRWASRVGEDNILISFGKDDQPKINTIYEDLDNEVLKFAAQLLIIDTAADTFGGNENIRPQVRQFINLLGKLALERNCAVVLCAHPSLSGISNGTGAGGSTAWNNTVRSRLYLEYEKSKDKDEDLTDPSLPRILTRKKANYARTGDIIKIQWDRGAFWPHVPANADIYDRLEQRKQEEADEAAFLSCLDALTRQGRNVSGSRQAANSVRKLMFGKPEVAVLSATRLEKAMDRLFDKGLIEVGNVSIGKNRHKIRGLIRVDQKTDDT